MKVQNEIMGYWHLATHPEKSYSASLLIEGSNASLRFIGCEFDDKDENQFVVYGTSINGKKITLIDCIAYRKSINAPGIPVVEIKVLYYLEGGHFTKETQFHKLKLKLNGLGNWINTNGFKNKDYKDGVMVKYKSVSPILFYHKNHLKFYLRLDGFIKRSHHYQELREDCYIMIENEEGFYLHNFWHYIYTIKVFFTLAYFSEPITDEIKLVHENHEIDFLFFDGAKKEEVVEQKERFLFEYTDLKKDFVPIFERWMDIHPNIEPIVGLLLESFSNRIVAVENKFLNVMHAIESFHRRRRNNKKIPELEHKSKIKDIIESCPEEHRSWLKERLNYSNEPSLKERLEELFSEIDQELKNTFFPDFEQMIKHSKNARNFFTHYDKSLEKKILPLLELHNLYEKLRLFLLILLLKEIHMDPRKVKDIVLHGSNWVCNHLINKG